MLEVNNLHKSFHEHAILHGVTFRANKGDVVALMGSSGSGKSTLLRCMNLLTIPTVGDIRIGEISLHFGKHQKPFTQAALLALRKKVGMVFQHFNLWAHKTVLENLIEAPIYVLKRDKKSAIEEAAYLLQKVGLSHRLHHYPSALSGGQQQRAAIARALMMKPELMLFDEPTSALDPEMVGEVLAVMQQLASEGMTMLIATHEISFAKRVATEAIFLEHGNILEQGDAETMFNSPKTPRFQRFLEAVRH